MSAANAAQTTQLTTLKAQLSQLTVKEKKAREEQEGWVKEEKLWEDKEREWEAKVEALEKENRKIKDRVSHPLNTARPRCYPESS